MEKIFKKYKAGIILSVVIICIAEFFTASFSHLYMYFDANFDMQTTGIIRILDKEVKGFPIIIYTYSVSDKKYSSRNIDFRNNSPRQLISLYKEGEAVIVFYDSMQPEYSTLKITSPGFMMYVQIISVFIGSVLCLWIFRKD